MHTLSPIITRCAVVALALSILSACSDDPTTSSPPPGDPLLTVEVAFCSGLEPDWVAFQDGDGAWTRALPSATSRIITFRHPFAANRGAIATVHRFAASVTTLSVRYGAPAELESVGDTVPEHCGPPVSKTLLGTVAGLDTNELAIVSAGHNARAVVFPIDGAGFALGGLIPEPQEILATRITRVNGGAAPTGMILRRSPDLPDNATIPVLDFNSPEAFQPVLRNVTLDGLGPEGAIAFTGLRTAHSNNEVLFLTGGATDATRPYYAIPEARLDPGDLQILTASAGPATQNVVRGTTLYFRSPVDRTLRFGAVVAPPTVSLAAAAPTLRLRAQFAPHADYDRLALIVYQQTEVTLVGVAMTTAYAALTGGAYDLVVPELTGVPGFDPSWALRAGTPVLWTADRVGGTLGLGPSAVPTDGATSRVAAVTGGFASP